MKEKILIIAEAGVNHNGSLEMALRLVDAAAEAGADVVKFQTFKAARLATADAKKADYQKQNLKAGNDSQIDMLRRLELSEADHKALIERCRMRGIRFLSTPFDEESVEMLASLGMNIWKIPSGEITNFPLLRKIALQKGRVILSTGMSTLEDVAEAIAVLKRFGKSDADITLLHCTTQYPTPLSDVNLLAMKTLSEKFGMASGYSDHTKGIEVDIAAAALGACVIEKHFTLDRNLEGPDHKASLEPDELAEMVRCVRNVEQALGTREKCVAEAEKGNISVARKSIVAAKNITKGETFTEENLTVKRPGTGLSPMRWEEVIGKKSTRDYVADQQIKL